MLEKFAYRPEHAQEYIDSINNHGDTDLASELSMFIAEVCSKFDLKFAYNEDMNRPALMTPSGLNIANVSVEKSFSQGKNKTLYVFRSPLIQKSRGGSDSRISEKIPSIIKTLKKNDEVPSHGKFAKRIIDAVLKNLDDPFNNLSENSWNASTVSFSTEMDLALAKHILDVKRLDETQMEEVRRKYSEYANNQSNKARWLNEYKRFMRGGFYLVGVPEAHGLSTINRPLYYIGDVTMESDSGSPQGGKLVSFKVNAVDSMYSEGCDRFLIELGLAKNLFMTGGKVENKLQRKCDDPKDPFYIPSWCLYIPDLDMAVTKELGVRWVVIPKVTQ